MFMIHSQSEKLTSFWFIFAWIPHLLQTTSWQASVLPKLPKSLVHPQYILFSGYPELVHVEQIYTYALYINLEFEGLDLGPDN